MCVHKHNKLIIYTRKRTKVRRATCPLIGGMLILSFAGRRVHRSSIKGSAKLSATPALSHEAFNFFSHIYMYIYIISHTYKIYVYIIILCLYCVRTYYHCAMTRLQQTNYNNLLQEVVRTNEEPFENTLKHFEKKYRGKNPENCTKISKKQYENALKKKSKFSPQLYTFNRRK